MPELDTLVEDIYSLFEDHKEHNVSHDRADKLGRDIAGIITTRLSDEEQAGKLRLSNIGTPCKRKLHYKLNDDVEGEPLLPNVKLKFLFGDVLELILLFLAEEAGHTVEGQQDTLVLSGIEGHRDAIIDGVTVDVKSASTFSFNKFREGRLHEDDPFGYITQLGSYVLAGRDDPRVRYKDTGAFLVFDKQHGHITLDTHNFGDFSGWEETIEETKEIVNNDQELPNRSYSDVEDGKSGNRKLATVCSYCEYRHHCWPGLRTFLYSSGPRYLTHVEKEPRVPEVIDGRVVRPEEKEDNNNGTETEGAW